MDKLQLLLELSNRCKEKRKEKRLSLEDIYKLTYIPIDILNKLEMDEEYIKNNPYSKFLLKFIAKVLKVDISDIEELLNKPEEIKSKNSLDIKKGINTTVSIVLSLSTIIYASNINKENKNPDKFEVYLKLISEENNETVSQKLTYASSGNQNLQNEEKIITFKAKGKVWLTAYIDGNEKVIKLTKGDKVNVKFYNKIKIETVGNADNLFITFKGKTVKLSENSKILHNIFIDDEGVFLNGYNILSDIKYTQAEIDSGR